MKDSWRRHTYRIFGYVCFFLMEGDWLMTIIKRSMQSIRLLLVLLLALMPAVAAAKSGDETNYKPTLNYVALGDSLAAGFLNSGSVGEGYPVYIKRSLEDELGYSVHLSNEGVGGYRTVDVLKQLENETVKREVIEADLITLDIGANDVLQKVGTSPDTSDPNVIAAVTQAIQEIQSNLDVILKEIKELNPDAPLYVMGYYNAIPYADGQDAIVLMINALNSVISGEAKKFEAEFVPTFDLFAGHYEQYLPNHNNIHPNADGYKVIAGRFLEKIIPFFATEIVPGAETPVHAKQRVTIQGTKNVITLPSDLPVGTTLTVTDASQSDAVTSNAGLKPAGDVYRFDFKYPDGTSSKGPFILTMGYDADRYVKDQVDIYAYNEAKGMWEEQNGTVDEAAGTITVSLSHFSTYGVFAKINDGSNHHGGEPADNGDSDNAGSGGNNDNTGHHPGTHDNNGQSSGSHNSASPGNGGAEQGGRLPDTASPNAPFILFGFLLAAAGAVLIWRNKKSLN